MHVNVNVYKLRSYHLPNLRTRNIHYIGWWLCRVWESILPVIQKSYFYLSYWLH